MPELALVRGLLGWVPRSADWVGVLAGPLVVAGYLVGSLPFTRFARGRLRGEARAEGVDGLAAAVLAAVAAVAVATVAWDVALAAAPNSRFTAVSNIALYSNQVLPAWASVALWTGAAVVVGHAAPVWRGFRGGSGVPPAAVLVFAHAPALFVAAGATFLVATLLGAGPRTSLLASLPVAVTVGWLAWIVDFQGGWGLTNGPELSLWVSVVAGVVFARNFRVQPADR